VPSTQKPPVVETYSASVRDLPKLEYGRIINRERMKTVVVLIAVVAAIVCFIVPMPWAAISAAIALVIAIPWFMTARRKP
jgi:uncharacterized membrane protein YbaN (DUF454 family)